MPGTGGEPAGSPFFFSGRGIMPKIPYLSTADGEAQTFRPRNRGRGSLPQERLRTRLAPLLPQMPRLDSRHGPAFQARHREVRPELRLRQGRRYFSLGLDSADRRDGRQESGYRMSRQSSPFGLSPMWWGSTGNAGGATLMARSFFGALRRLWPCAPKQASVSFGAPTH